MEARRRSAARGLRYTLRTVPRDLSRVEKWEKTSEVPLLLFAAAFLVAYAWPILDPNLDPDLETFFFYASWTVWVAFTIDFLIRLWLSERRGYTPCATGTTWC